jgi:membrane protein
MMEKIVRLLTTTAMKWLEDNPWRLSAALSYYMLFSLAPLLTLAVAGAAVVVDERVVQSELLRQLKDLIGEHGTKAMTPMLYSAGHPVHGSVATLISVITLFIVSMGMFSELQDALNFIWRIPPRARRSSALLRMLRTRLLLFFAGHRDRVPSRRRRNSERRDGRCRKIHQQGDGCHKS